MVKKFMSLLVCCLGYAALAPTAAAGANEDRKSVV